MADDECSLTRVWLGARTRHPRIIAKLFPSSQWCSKTDTIPWIDVFVYLKSSSSLHGSQTVVRIGLQL